MDYFKPLRRKLGVVTLLMACVLMALWVRSFVVADEACIYGYFYPRVSIDSGLGSIQILGWTGQIIGREFWITRPFFEREANLWLWPTGVAIMTGDDVVAEGEGYNVPYWSIVLPLTAISGWLLLSKLRPPPGPTHV